MATKNRRIEADLITTDQPVRSDYALMQVTLTLAVESYVCDDHAAQMHEAAIESVLDRFADSHLGDDIIVLRSEFTPLTLNKQVQS
jgi:hypothetical protein